MQKRYRCTAALTIGVASIFGSSAWGQTISVNYDALSSLEQPLAREVGDVTFILTGLVDGSVYMDHDVEGDLDTFQTNWVGQFELNVETQLPNRWNVGIAHFGQYEEDPFFGLDGSDDDDYTSNTAGFVGGAWGTLVAGNTSGLVAEETRRLRQAGNGFLAFEGPLANLTDSGGGYVGRFGPTRLSAFVDDDGNYELGYAFQRPIASRDWRVTARFTDTEFVGAGGDLFDSQSLSGLVELTYGSSVFDVALGVESLESDTQDVSVERVFGSVGARHKIGRWTFSSAAHYGKTDGDEELSGTLGVTYDVARGLSANLGVNYEDARIINEGVVIVDAKEAATLFSLRYSF